MPRSLRWLAIRLDAHWAAAVLAGERQAEHQLHGIGLERVDLEALLDPDAALLDRHRAVAERRARAIPEALPRVLLHRAQHRLWRFDRAGARGAGPAGAARPASAAAAACARNGHETPELTEFHCSPVAFSAAARCRERRRRKGHEAAPGRAGCRHLPVRSSAPPDNHAIPPPSVGLLARWCRRH